MKKRVVIADAQVATRGLLTLMLSRDFVIEIVAETNSGLQAVELCRKFRPDFLLLDLLLPDQCGTEVLQRLRKELPGTRAVVFATACSTTLIQRALKCRPMAFVSKNDSLQTLREALLAVLHGSSYFTPFVAQHLFDPPGEAEETLTLSDREKQVLQMIAEGRSNKEMASLLKICGKTAEHHRENLKRKLDVRTIAGLTREALRRGLIEP